MKNSRYAPLLERLTLDFARQNLLLPGDYPGHVLGSKVLGEELAEEVNLRCLDWAAEHGVINSANEESIRRGRYALACLSAASVVATDEQLELIACAPAWIILVDDIIDSQGNLDTLSLADVRAAYSSFRSIFDDPDHEVDSNADYSGLFTEFCSLTRSFSRKIRAVLGPERAVDVARACGQFMDAITVEFCNSKRGILLDASGHLRLRSWSVGVRPVYEVLVGISVGRRWPHRDPLLSYMYGIAADIISIMNDMISLQKEQGPVEHTVGNIVSLEYEQVLGLGLPSERAADIAVDRCLQRYRGCHVAFERYARCLPEELGNAVTALRCAYRAIVDWHLHVTDRY